MAQALNVNDVVHVSVSFTLSAGTYRNFNSCMVVGSSPIIDVNQRKRTYSDLDGVAADFGTTAPEYLWAQAFFSQSPQPAYLNVARWAQTATAAILHGASLTPAQRLMSVFNAITTGAFTISVNGTAYALTGLNFSGATNLNGVASIIQTALLAAGAPAGTRVIWGANNLRFDVISGTTGPASTLSYATAPASGTDISVILGLSVTANSTGANANPPVNGIAAESALACISALGDAFGDWYAVDFAPLTTMSDADKIAVAGYIEGAGRSRIFGSTVQNTAAVDSTRSDDLGAVLSASKFERSLTQFSTASPYAMASLFGRIATVNYLGADTTITLMFKQEPGIAAENLTETKWAALKAKSYNVSAAYQNGASILQNGVMASGQFIDNRIGADWLADYLQTNAFNLLTSLPKIPQTDGGMALLAANMTQSLEQAATNGFLAAGQWNGPNIGTITNGKFLPLGFEIYYPQVASQSETDRAARKSVPFQIAAKLAGAVHSVDVAITINP